MRDDEPAIDVRRLSKRYGDVTAVDRLDLRVERGEVFGLLGPNGAGKTTTILMLLGLTEPSEGTVRVVGLDPTRDPLGVKSRVGYLPDSVGFYNDLTARQNLRYTARLNRLPADEGERRAASLLEAVGLTERADDRVGAYSRGMVQRLGIADALLKDPSVLILDEPTIGLDPNAAEAVLTLIHSLAAERGVTVLLSSHMLTQVQAICHRIGIFVRGRLVASGTIEELAAAHGGRYVIEVEVAGGDPEPVLRDLPGVVSVQRSGTGWVVGAQDDVREHAARALADRGLVLRHLRQRPEELGEIYRRYFAEEPVAKRGAELVTVLVEGTTQRLRRLPVRAKLADWRLLQFLQWRADTGERADARRPATAGWRIVAAKEFADNLFSIRYLVLLVLLGLASIGAVATAADAIRDAASEATGSPSPFLLLFTASPERLPSFVIFVAFLGPLLGIAFGFDTINNERAQGTLPRLVAQPIHRDDVVNGKFVAGLAVIAVTLTALTAIVAGVGILRLGITPGPEDVARLIVYLVVACVYIGLWLAFAVLCSVTMRRAATSALVAIAAWIVLTLFGALLVGLLADAIAPAPEGATLAQQLAHARLEHGLSRLSPATLYQEATAVLLNPEVRTVGLVLPRQVDQAIPGPLPLGQSLLVVWPQVTALVAVTVVVFAVAYLVFLRQEVRA